MRTLILALLLLFSSICIVTAENLSFFSDEKGVIRTVQYPKKASIADDIDSNESPIISASIDPLVILTDEVCNIVVTTAPNVASVTLKIMAGTILHEGLVVETLVLYDDGTHGDQVAGDNKFTINDIYFSFVNSSYFEGSPLISTNWLIENATITYDDNRTEIVELNYYVATKLIKRESYIAPATTIIEEDLQKTDYLINLIVESDPPDYPLDLFSVINRYYNTFQDDRDFLVVEDTFPRPTFRISGYYCSVSNHDQGFNIPIFDNTSVYGSAGRLKGFIKTYNTLNSGLLNHEILHRWAAYLTEIGSIHWNVIQRPSSGFGRFWGAYGEIFHTSERRYRAIFNEPEVFIYNDLELYLMGLITSEDVKWPIQYLINPTFIEASYDQTPYYKDFDSDGIGELFYEQIAATYGQRIPAAGEAQNHFNLGTIVVSPRLLTETEIAYYEMLIREYGKQSSLWSNFWPFAAATGNKAQLTTSLPPLLRNTNITPTILQLLLEE